MKASELSGSLSQSLLILLFWPNQEKVRSTIHLFGKKALGPLGFSCIFSRSSCTPSLVNSLTHFFITSSGTSFGGWRTISAVHPIIFCTQSAPLSWPL